jgi:hypothetical protein
MGDAHNGGDDDAFCDVKKAAMVGEVAAAEA